MATEAPARTHCPNCGAQLKRADLSLCAYCAMPLAMGGKAAADDETVQRLKRMREHPNFAAAQAFVPLDPEVEKRVATLRNRGLAVVLAGIAVAIAVVLVQVLGAGFDWKNPWNLLGDGIAAVGVILILGASSLRKSGAGGKPLLVRPAIVSERRSETDQEGRWGAKTIYFFTLRFDDGSEGEFRWPGQGLSNEPMTNGQTGIAYTRGADLVAYRKLA